MKTHQRLHLCFLADLGSVHTQRWLRFYIDRGHQVSVITFRPGPDLGASVHLMLPTMSSKARYLIAAPSVRRLVRRLAPDVLHAHHATSFGLLGALADWQPLVITCHGSDLLVSPKRSRVLRRTTAWALERADVVTAASDALGRAARRLTGGRVRPRVFQYGLDLNIWRYRDRPSQRSPVRIMSTRALSALYDVETLIRATPIVRRKLGQVEVVVCGDGPLRPALEQLAVELGVADVVRFLGSLSEEALAAELGDADIYVSTSHSDGLSLALLEAMATGLYPIVTNITANRDLITNGVNGTLFPVGDAEALAAAVIAQEGNAYESAVRDNRIYVERYADRSVILGDFEQCYYALADGANQCSAAPVRD